jgi:hypothetical protein
VTAFVLPVAFGLSAVIAGPDPAIHAADQQTPRDVFADVWRVVMDARVKPGHDAEDGATLR